MDEQESSLPQAGPSKPSLKDQEPSLDALKTLDPLTFNVEAFEGTYKGRALITRYLHMTKLLSSNPSLAKWGYQNLYPKVKETWDFQLYLNVMSRLNKIVSSPETNGMEVDHGAAGGIVGEAMGVPDMGWVETTIEAERKESAKLDVELRGYMSNLIKESIRLTYLASADLAVKVGNWHNANKNYAASREYSSSPQHHLDLGLGILETALVFNQPGSLPGQIPKLESYLDRLHPPTAPSTARANAPDAAMTAGDVRENREREARGQATRRKVGIKIRVARGVLALSNKEYERAGKELSEVGEEGGLGDWEGQAISTADICLITAFCVLASGSRDQIRQVLLDRPSFRIGMDDSQGWLLDLIRAFMDAQYGRVSTILSKMEPYILLNPFLYPHTPTLIQLIRTRSIVQYIEPFSSIRIDTMASAFAMTVDQVLETMEELIKEGKIKGKIDLIDMVLVVPTPNIRNQLYDRAIKVGKETVPRTHGAWIRMKLVEAGINVDPRPNQDRKTNGGWDDYGPSNGFRMGPTDSSDHLDVDAGVDTDMPGFQDADFVEALSSDGEVVVD